MSEGPMTKHQHLARTGEFHGQAKGGSVPSHRSSERHGGHTSMKHGHHVGHGAHGHKGPHEHHTNPGHHSAGSGHDGHSIHKMTDSPAQSTSTTYTDEIGTDGGGGSHHKHGGGGGGTGGTRNPI